MKKGTFFRVLSFAHSAFVDVSRQSAEFNFWETNGATQLTKVVFSESGPGSICSLYRTEK